jgi:hypothetical protein
LHNLVPQFDCISLAKNLILAKIQERGCCDLVSFWWGINLLSHFSACAYILMIFSARVIKSARADKPRALHGALCTDAVMANDTSGVVAPNGQN